MVFAVLVLAILLTLWMFRAGYRDARASAKTTATTSRHVYQPANREAEDFYLKGRFYWNNKLLTA